MKRTIAGGLLAAVTLLGGLAITSTAQATKPDDGGDRKPAVCHPVEGRGETGNGWNIISPDKASSHIDEETGAGKHTRKDGRTDVYVDEAGKCPGPEIPEWTPPTYPPFNVPECQEYQIEKWTSTYDGDTGTWSAWADWPGAGPVDDDGRDKTGHHGGDHKEDGDRHFAYIIIPGDLTTTGECAPPPVCGEEGWQGELPCNPCPYNPDIERDDEDCEEPTTTTTPTPPPPATTEPPVVTTTTEPPVITTTVPPTVPPTVAPTTPPPPPATPTRLPDTGSNSTWMIAIIAGLLSMAGLGAMRLARRNS